jgi:hypothetical protein
MARAPTVYPAYLSTLRRQADSAGLELSAPRYNWIETPDIAPKSHIGISIARRGARGIRVSLNNTDDSDRSILDRLRGDAGALSAQITPELDWDNPEQRQKSTVRAGLECDVTDLADWERQHRWIIETVREFTAAFEGRLNFSRQ